MFKTTLLIIVISISFASFADDFIFGVGIHPLTQNLDNKRVSNILTGYGFSSFRTDYPWSRVEKIKGIYQTADYKIDNMIDIALAKGIKPMLILDYGNVNYDLKTAENPRSKPNSEESRLAFAKYSSWVSLHFKDKINLYEIWNEWIQTDGRKGAGFYSVFNNESADIYADLVIKSCRAIKINNPDAIVVAGGIDPFDDKSNKWLAKVISKNVMSCLDGISIHPYYFQNKKEISSEPVVNILKYTHEFFVKENHGREVNFYITEIGVPITSVSKYSIEDIESYFNDFYQNAYNLKFVKGVWWYDLIDDGKNKNITQDNFGLFYNDGADKKIMRKSLLK